MDDSDTRLHTWPRMTAVCQDATMLGYEAANWLTRRLQSSDRANATASMRLHLPTTFEVNGTTAAPGGEAIDIAPNVRPLTPSRS
jgi:DNA-binding LacI/PurR family transcriptional regulator